MVASFFGKAGHMTTVPLENQYTVTAQWYTGTYLPKVFESWTSWHSRTGLQGLLLHHDNATAHTASATLQFLEQN